MSLVFRDVQRKYLINIPVRLQMHYDDGDLRWLSVSRNYYCGNFDNKAAETCSHVPQLADGDGHVHIDHEI